MFTHVPYPPRLACVRDECLGLGALVIERSGYLQIAVDGLIVVIAYRRVDVWLAHFGPDMKTAHPINEDESPGIQSAPTLALSAAPLAISPSHAPISRSTSHRLSRRLA